MRAIRHLWILPAGIVLVWVLVRVSRPDVQRQTSAARQETVVPSSAVRPANDIMDAVMKSYVPAEDFPRLRDDLLAMNPADAVRRVGEMLATGKNRPTGMDFTIGTDRGIDGWPTLRTFLLDMLFRIDPAGALEISRGILETPGDPDEWAVALRNIGAAGDPAKDRGFLIAKTEDLIRNPEWQAKPSVGYLNAFDVLVQTSAVESAPLLSSLVRNKDRRDLAHAAFLTMDRLVQRSPAAMLGQIAADTDLQRARPEMAAQQFARADLRETDQREIVRNWLLSPTRTEAELRAFSGIYPNNNRFVSNNLLTTETPQSGAELAAHDRAAKDILTEWSADPEFAAVKLHIDAMLGRLSAFTAQPATSTPSQ